MRFQAYLPFLLASLALATPIAQDAGENPNLVGEPDTQGLDITAERFIAFERPDGYNPSLTQTDIEFVLDDPNSGTRHVCKGSVAGILQSVDRYDDCVGLEPNGESHFRFSITEGNAVLPGKKNSEFALKVERLRKGVTIHASAWVKTNCAQFHGEESTICKAPANIKLEVNGEAKRPEKCNWYKKTFQRAC